MLTWFGLISLVACTGAITRDQFYPYGDGLDQSLPRGSRVPSPEVQLQVPIVFYGETYENIFVNNYGVLSFRSDIPTFLNAEFPLPYPSIASFYTNIDTTDSGAIYYRETNDTHVLLKAYEIVQNNFHDYIDFRPTSVFIATWIDVTYTSHQQNHHKNSFQIAVISNGTESFVEFLYPEGEIQWIKKETQSSLHEAKAQAGFIGEDGRVFNLRGSGSQQIRNIDKWSNTHEPGKYLFRVGDIPYDGNVAAPDQYNQNEKEMEEESMTCAQSGLSVCHIQAHCVDYESNICCKCNDDYYGNGKSCIKNDEPLRVYGKVNGVLNNVNLSDVDIQAYVIVADGRSHTALSQVPQNLGSSLEFLNVLGGVIGWLFAKPVGSARNGYQLTGALFNHTADIFFPATNDRVAINQEYLGHDVFDQITLKTDIRGTLPFLPVGTKIDITEYEEQQLTIVDPGVIRSESKHIFKNKDTDQIYEEIVTQTFTFNPSCRYALANEEDNLPLTLKVSKNHLEYESKDNIIRYGSSNKISLLGKEDACKDGRNHCGPHGSCVVKGNSDSCVCRTGYTSINHQSNLVCTDIDECEAGTHNCDNNADCYNHVGGFQCRCRDGFEGNGVTCHRTQRCTSDTCGFNAQCVKDQGKEPVCVCSAGYIYKGHECVKVNNSACDYCHTQATCILAEVTNMYYCQCKPGYEGNGYQCDKYQQNTRGLGQPLSPQVILSAPHVNQTREYRASEYDADLLSSTTPGYDHSTNEAEYSDTIVFPQCDTYGCTCPSGYTNYIDEENNELCRLNTFVVSSPETLPESNDTPFTTYFCYSNADCPLNAVCIDPPADGSSKYGHCVCPEGYVEDGFGCTERTGTCSCGQNAHCITVAATREVICACDSGYHSDGYTCRPNFSCSNDSDCEYNAECKPDLINGEYVCQCIDGYIKDENDACIRYGQLCNGAECPEHTSCIYDQIQQVSYCH